MAEKIVSHDEWTTKEKFILACCVTRSGDQNWVSVCRTMRLILEACDDSLQRPPDFFSQKNCAMKYNQLLNTASVMKRKSRGSSTEPINIETPAEQILRKLTFQRIEELDRAIKADRDKYKKLKTDVEKIRSGKLDDQLPRIWQAIQSGQAGAIEDLIQEDPPVETSKGKEETQTTATSTTSISQSTPSRPQRATKETEKFKSYIEQRQKHNAKYHHTTSSVATTPASTPPASSQSSSTTALSTTSDLSVISTSVVGPSPAQVQNMASRLDTTLHTPASSQGLLIMKSDAPSVPSQLHVEQQSKQINTQLQKPSDPKKSTDQSKSQASGPISPVRKMSDNKETSYLSSLLASPAADIKAQVNQINEVLKEPIKNIHQVTIESYKAYKKAQPVNASTLASKETAPMLSKLLKSTHIPAQLDSITVNTSLGQPLDSIKKESSSELKQVAGTTTTSSTLPTPVAPLNTVPQEVAKTSIASLSKDESKQKEEETLAVIVKQEEAEPEESRPDSKLEESTIKQKGSVLAEKNPEPLSIDIDSKVDKVPSPSKDRAESSSSIPETCEPPAKKRLIEAIPSGDSEVVNTSPLEPLDLSLVHSPKTKRKGKVRGNRSVSRKKTPPGSMKFDIPSEDDADTESEVVNESKDTDVMDSSDDFTEKKIKTPLTPSIPSPASPALSTGSNCDPETAQQQRAWRKSIMLVWKAGASHKYANVFLHPVTDEEAPGYSSIIYRPMDLSLIKKNIETGVIHTTTEFQRDIMLMFQNALMYNRKEHDVYRMAQEMRDDVMEQIKSFISTQLMVQTTDRDSKILRVKVDTPGHTRQSSKSGFTFLSL